MSLIFNKNDKGEIIGKLSNGDFFNIGKSKFLIYLTNNVDDIETTFDEIKQKIKSEYINSNELDKYLSKNNSIKIPELIFTYFICPDIKNITEKEYLHWEYLYYNENLVQILKSFYYYLKNDNLNQIKEFFGKNKYEYKYIDNELFIWFGEYLLERIINS